LTAHIFQYFQSLNVFYFVDPFFKITSGSSAQTCRLKLQINLSIL